MYIYIIGKQPGTNEKPAGRVFAHVKVTNAVQGVGNAQRGPDWEQKTHYIIIIIQEPRSGTSCEEKRKDGLI